jgi:hypothetical protein
MADVAYFSWSLIHQDLEPAQQQPTLPQPPMLTTIALDPRGSLCFVFRDAPERLSIRLVITGISAEGQNEDLLRVYRGEPGAYTAVEATWSRGQDGPDAVFTTEVSASGDHLKLHLSQGRTVIVTGASFTHE